MSNNKTTIMVNGQPLDPERFKHAPTVEDYQRHETYRGSVYGAGAGQAGGSLRHSTPRDRKHKGDHVDGVRFD